MIRALLILCLGAPGLEREVERLGSDDPQVRVAAQTELLRQSRKAVPVLWASLDHEDKDVRRSVAALLDVIWKQTVDAGRRNPEYVFPFDESTIREDQAAQAPPPFFTPEEHYMGVLADWRQPTLADYNGLLYSLSEMVRGIPRFPTAYACACTAAAKAAIRIRKSMRPDWRTRWVVRRELLPEIEDAVAVRGKKITDFECFVLIGILDHVEGLPDARIKRKAKMLRADVRARLSVILERPPQKQKGKQKRAADRRGRR